MAFSDDAIGFFLQLEDQLSPALATAETNYGRFVKSLDKHNQKAFRSANQGMSALAEVVDGFKQLPKAAETAYDDAMRRMRRKSKPLTQKINLELSGRSKQELAKTIGQAVAKVLSNVKVRLSAEAPLRKSKLFDTSVALRQSYKGQVQPPDMAGMFQNIPRFAEGGMVDGPPGLDKVLAFLSKGELVLPADLSEQFLKAVSAGEGEILGLAEQSFVETVADMQNIVKALERINDLAETGLDPKAMDSYADGVAALNQQYEMMREALGGVSAQDMPAFLGTFKEAGDTIEKFNKTLEETEAQVKDTGQEANTLLAKILGPARFLAIHTALTEVQRGFQGIMSSASATFSTLEGEQIGNFVENVNQMNQRLGLSREELREFKRDAVATLQKSLPAGIVSLAEFSAVLEAGSAAGQKNRETLLRLAPAITAAAKASTATTEALTQTAVKLQDLAGFDENQIAAIFEKTRVTARETFSDTGQLIEQVGKLTESAGKSFLDLTTDQQTAFINNLTGLSASMANVWGDNAGAISQLIADAFRGGPEEMARFAQITGMQFEDVRKIISTEGADLSSVVTGITRNFEGLGETGFEVFREALGVPLTNEELGALVQNQDAVTSKMQELRGVTVDGSNAMSSLTEAARANQTVFENVKNQVGAAIANFEAFGISGVEVLDFVKEMPPSLIFAGVEVAKFTVQIAAMAGKLAFAGVKALFFSGAQAAANAAAVASAPASTTMAAGLAALAPAVPVVLAVAAAVLAVGVAVKLAEGPLVALVRVLGTAVEGVVALMQSMTQMSASELTALALALPSLGISFALLGGGIATMSTLLVASVPGLVGFALAMRVLGAVTGSTTALADVVNGMVQAFAVDPVRMRRAVRAIGLTVEFLAGFTVAAGQLAALAIDTVVGNAVSAVMQFFGAKSPFEQLSAQSKAMHKTVTGIADTFGGMSDKELDGLRDAADAFEIIGQFMQDYAATVAVVQGAAPNLLVEKISTELRKAWNMQGPFGRLASQAGQMKSTVRLLAGTFGKIPKNEMTELMTASENMKVLAEFVDRYAFVAEVLDDIDNLLVQEGVMGMISHFGSGSPFENLKAQAKGIVETMDEVITVFAGPTAEAAFEPERMEVAAARLKQLGKFVPALKPTLEAMQDVGELAGELRDSSWWQFWAGDGPLTNLREVAPEMVKTLNVLVDEFSSIEMGGPMDAVGDTLKSISVTVEGVGAVTKSLSTLAADVGSLSDVDLNQTFQRVGTILKVARRVQGAFRETEARIETLQPEVSARVTPAQIQEVITVKLDPDTTDKPVHTELQRTNTLLEQLIAAQGTVKTAPTMAPARRGAAGQGTRDLASGKL